MSTTFNLSEAKKADDITKLLIFGYIRNQCNVHRISTNIPDLICFIILLYFMEQEYFDKPGKGCEISEDKLSITQNTGYGYNSTTYCKQWIPSTSNLVVTWTFQIEYIDLQMLIGVTDNADCTDKDFSELNTTYALGSNGDWRIGDGTVIDEDVAEMEFSTGDEIVFILNLVERTILFKVSDKEKIVVWNDIKVSEEIEYKLAVCLRSNVNKIKLIDFSKEFV